MGLCHLTDIVPTSIIIFYLYATLLTHTVNKNGLRIH